MFADMVILGSAVLFVFCFFLICFLILSSFGFSVCLLLSTCMLMTIVNIQFLLIRFLAISFGEGNGTPLQYSCLENPMDGGAWWAAVHGVATSRTGLSDFTFTFPFHALEKETATHSSVLAWRIPGMG